MLVAGLECLCAHGSSGSRVQCCRHGIRAGAAVRATWYLLDLDGANVSCGGVCWLRVGGVEGDLRHLHASVDVDDAVVVEDHLPEPLGCAGLHIDPLPSASFPPSALLLFAYY